MEAQMKELVAVFGPTGGVLLWLLIQSVWGKKEAADPLHDLAEEMRRDAAALQRDLAEARDEQRREVADLRRELSAARETMAGMRATLDYMRERGK
jgi:hypothetical protein